VPTPDSTLTPPVAVCGDAGGLDARYEQLRHAALHARAEAFPLGLAVLTRHGLTAWTRTLTELAPVPNPPAPTPADPPGAAPAAVTRELVSILTALTLAPTQPGRRRNPSRERPPHPCPPSRPPR
jgi:hypothetical protein